MVYYQSMPLIVKSEPTSQAEFCTPLVGGSTTTTTAAATTNLAQFQEQQQLQHQNVAHNYSIHSVNRSTMVIQQQQQTSINNINNNCNTNFLTTNIKTELLPPGLSVYAASTSAAATNHSSITPAITTINVSNNAPLTTATVSEIARKSATIKPQFKCEQCGMTFGSKSAHTSHTKSHAKSNSNNSSSNGELLLVNGGGGIANAQQQLMLAEVSSDVMQLSLGMPKTSLIKLNAAAGATVASASISNSGGTGDPYECNVCQKTFAVPARLIRHYRTHTGERPFECEFCHKLFSVKENLQVHRRIHTKERPYKCDVCGRAFEHSGKLHRHMRIHTGERPHKCSVCGKTFIQSGQLVIHMRTHTGEKPYKCPVEGCGKGFTCSKQLKVHSRTHTGEKPYHCDICFRDFGYNHVLKLHRVQHYGSKCYKCTICDETFKNKKEMEAHIKGHANELPDDEAEDESGASNSEQGSSNSSSLGDTTNSAPDSPQSPTSSLAATVTTSTETLCRNALKPKKNNAVKRMAATPLSPNSPGSSLSPLSSAVTRLSTASPNTLITSASASPALSLTHETEHTQQQQPQQQPQQQIYIAASTLYNDINGRNNAVAIGDELPTDLRVLQQQQQQHQHVSNMYQQRVATYTYVLHSPPPLAQILPKQQQLQQSVSLHELTATSTTAAATGPTINPALLEAASIAKRISHVSLAAAEEEEDAETQAALQIMQLNRAQQQQQQQQRHYQKKQVVSDLPHYDDTHEANELIEHYKRGELARHGLHKRYAAPVPKFETSLLHNEIVRQVEAAIAPLRSSTESPERSSSPESDSMMMADRDVMTLPLRKRKLYMNKGPTTGSSVNGLVTEVTNNTTAVSNIGCALTATNSGNMHGSSNELGNKVLRMSSVIQFAKASKKSVATKQN